MKKRLLSLGMMLVLCASMLLACGKKPTVTAKDVINGMNGMQPDSFEVSMGMTADADIVIQGAPINLKYDVNYDVEAERTDEKVAMHMLANVDTSVLGMKQNANVDAYISLNNEGTDVYMNSAELGSGWYKVSPDQMGVQFNAFEALNNSANTKKAEISDDDPLADAKVTEEKYNDVDCYKLTYTGDFSKYAKQAVQALNESGFDQAAIKNATGYDIDIEKVLSEINMTMEIYAAKADYAPVAMKVDLSETDVMKLLDACGINPSSLTGGLGIQITGINLNALSAEVVFKKINGVTVEVPADVEKNAKVLGN